MKYVKRQPPRSRRRPVIVEATQFSIGETPWPDGVCNCDNPPGFHVHTAAGGTDLVVDQAWIISDPSLGLYALPAESFAEAFEPAI